MILEQISDEKIFSESCYIKPNLYCNYTFPIDSATNGITFGGKSIGAVLIRSSTRSLSRIAVTVMNVSFSVFELHGRVLQGGRPSLHGGFLELAEGAGGPRMLLPLRNFFGLWEQSKQKQDERKRGIAHCEMEEKIARLMFSNSNEKFILLFFFINQKFNYIAKMYLLNSTLNFAYISVRL